MAQLLENGLANDLETAYAKAVRLNDEVWQTEQNRLLKQATNQASQAQRVAKAKAAAVSPKSVTPNAKAGATDKKDRRSILAEQMGEIGSRV
jgi:ABC-type Fe3+/spermidine/putrescine transport system ATPase subunit